MLDISSRLNGVKTVLLLDSHRNIVGGGQLSLLGLAKELDSSRFKAICVGPDGGSMFGAARAILPVLPLELPPFRLATLHEFVATVWRLCRLVRQSSADLMHANGSRSMLYAGIAGRICSVPVIWHVRVCPSDGLLDRVLAMLSSRLIVISRAVQKRFANVASAKVHLVYNGVSLEPYDEESGRELRAELGYEDVRLVGIVAQLLPVKRHQDFIEAMRIVGKRFRNTRFVIVGADLDPEQHYLQQLRDLVARTGMIERYDFLGYRDDIPRVMSMLDVVVLTSENEGLGRVLIEAMAGSRPVVATAVGGVPEVVDDGKTGILIPSAAPDALASAVCELLEHPDRARAMGAAGRLRAEASFGIAAHARRVESLYDEISSRGRAV